MRVFEVIEAWGHINITARNRTTFELTRENYLTRRGDCIIAINASKGAIDLGEEFKQMVKSEDAKITLIIEVGGCKEVVLGRGNPQLILSHPTDMVARKSSYICDRTLMVRADKAAKDFSRDLIREIQNPTRRAIITLAVEV